MAGSLDMGNGRRRGGIVGINVTPMVDVVLVLLVIMMVSAQYIVSRNIRVELPRTSTSDAPAQSPLTITIQRDGALSVNGNRVSEADLTSQLRAAANRDREFTVIVSADRAVSHGTVMHTVDLARAAGVLRFAINVERSE